MKGPLFEKKCPLHPKMLCAKFGWNWPFDSGEDFFLFCRCTFAISLLSPLGKIHDPSFGQTRILFTQKCFVSSLVAIGLVVLERNSKIWNLKTNSRRTTGDQKNSLELKIKGTVFIPFTIRKEAKQQHNLLKTCWVRNVYFNNSISWLNISFLLQFCMLKIHSFWKTNTVHCLSLTLRYSTIKSYMLLSGCFLRGDESHMINPY